MKGNNTIYLNQATIAAAVQFYFENIYREGAVPKVEFVEFVTEPIGTCHVVVRISNGAQDDKSSQVGPLFPVINSPRRML